MHFIGGTEFESVAITTEKKGNSVSGARGVKIWTEKK